MMAGARQWLFFQVDLGRMDEKYINKVSCG
jgi:hypothetical protein